MDKSTIIKFQQQFWITKQTFFKKLGKKEDEHIVSSDANLDAKLELFKSIQLTSNSMNKLLDRYQEKICYLAQEQNSMGRFLKEYGKMDKSNAGKIMIQMGKSLIYCSQQEIAIRPSLLRLYQEVDTFRSRAVEDTLETIKLMEKNRIEYRASLKWMKNVSQELDPDTYQQMEKYRKVQQQVKRTKCQFDKYKLACLQKVDLLAAARCNMFSHALIQYQQCIQSTTGKNQNIFATLADAFKGYQYYEFSVIKDLIGEVGGVGGGGGEEEKEVDGDKVMRKNENQYEIGAECLKLDDLIGQFDNIEMMTNDKEDDTLLDILSWPDNNAKSNQNEEKMDEFECFENDDDTLALLNELLNNPIQHPIVNDTTKLQGCNSSENFLPSHLLDFQEVTKPMIESDLLNFTRKNESIEKLLERKMKNDDEKKIEMKKSWYDIFADLDPISNPDSFITKKNDDDEIEQRYC